MYCPIIIFFPSNAVVDVSKWRRCQYIVDKFSQHAAESEITMWLLPILLRENSFRFSAQKDNERNLKLRRKNERKEKIK